MVENKFYDVLSIHDKNGNVDIIQSLLGNDCLGTYFKNGTAKLYFHSGTKSNIEILLQQINIGFPFKWVWEIQNKEDWHLSWRANFQPVIIEGKLAVIPHWQQDSPEEIVIKIKPGMAFGTGHHETTWLMLSQLIKHIKPGMSVLDLGTGSGILSIAAIKLGAEKVDGIENDLNCKINFDENLKLNNITKGIHYHQEDVLNFNSLEHDIILANINRNIIEQLIPQLHSAKGIIFLSGLLTIDYGAIEQLCNKHNFHVKEKMIKKEWVCIEIHSN